MSKIASWEIERIFCKARSSASTRRATSTRRDIATAAGVSLAAIGYRYGTKDALLNEAVVEAMHDQLHELRQAWRLTVTPAARMYLMSRRPTSNCRGRAFAGEASHRA
ncbi:hypothetical protein [Nonomuraea glycinis]|uniref:TetR family transcriptional regulator n=1 Tax=Nonomuraea glycinis TaxID=2047744 RepID=A0A918E7T3_9ACTN|nr:hypothetical protein GCM10012278_65390 [Nonomuraea glycinis]